MKLKIKNANDLLLKGTLAFSNAEAAGMRINTKYCKRKKAELTERMNSLASTFRQTNFYLHWKHYYGKKTNIDSTFQLSKILYKVRKFEPTKTTRTGQGSTDESALTQLGLPELDCLIERKKLKKIIDYFDIFLREQVDGFIHPFFDLHTAITYRSSSSRPNFQNIPKREKVAMNLVRRAIYPRHGYQLLEADYSGIEVNIALCYHKDPVMRKYLTDPGSDMHSDMTKQIYLLKDFDKSIPEFKYLRDAIKNGFVFPQFYGDYYVKNARALAIEWGKLTKGKWRRKQGVKLPDGMRLGEHLINQGIKDYYAFEQHIKEVEYDFWNRRFRVYKKWKDRWWKHYQELGYFDTLTGFRCSGLMSYNDVTNYPIQGSAFHCLLWSFIELDRIMRKEKWKTRIIGQIHDAIVLDVHPDELTHVAKTILRVTCKDLLKVWDWIIIPLEVEMDLCEVNKPWNTKKEYKIAS